jgi:hypothetical protein
MRETQKGLGFAPPSVNSLTMAAVDLGDVLSI